MREREPHEEAGEELGKVGWTEWKEERKGYGRRRERMRLE